MPNAVVLRGSKHWNKNMSRIGFYDDAPYKIEAAGSEITIKFIRNLDGTGTINWTLPTAVKCSGMGGPYDGIVIVVDNKPITLEQTPTDGSFYEGDPTVNGSLHAGDKIGSGRVVGAFYHDTTTTSLTVTDVDDRTVYYFAGFAVDGVAQYHQEGVHTYSQKYDVDGTGGEPSWQRFDIPGEFTDVVGITSDTKINFTVNNKPYSIDVKVGDTWNDVVLKLQTARLDGIQYLTGPLPPYEGGMFFQHNKLWKIVHSLPQEIPCIVTNDTRVPNQHVDGEHAVLDGVLHVWRAGWKKESDVAYTNSQPRDLYKCGTVYFDGNVGRTYDGNVWVEQRTFLSDASTVYQCGDIWFNPDLYNFHRYESNCDAGIWNAVTPIISEVEPTTSGVIWYQPIKQKIFVFDSVTNMWVSQNIVFSDSEPSNPTQWWMDTKHNSIHMYDHGVWVDRTNEVIEFNTNPKVVESGYLWWNPITTTMKAWDSVTYDWVPVKTVYTSTDVPSDIEPSKGDLRWVNGAITTYDGSDWITPTRWITYFGRPLSLTSPPSYMVSGNTLWFYDVSAWTKETTSLPYKDPRSIDVGTYWMDVSSNVVKQWDGSVWNTVSLYGTPISITIGTLWFDGVELRKWSGKNWDVERLPYKVHTTANYVVLENTIIGTGGNLAIDHNSGLFSTTVNPKPFIRIAVKGIDPVGATPMYTQLGVGTDGSSEERRELIETVLMSLGHPVVSIELTKQQLDMCVDQAIQNIRRYSSASYKRGFIMMELTQGVQRYVLSDKSNDMHRIVRVLSIRRSTSAFGSHNTGTDLYGQMMIQNMYSTTGFDLLTYHLTYEYSELVERLFAARMNFSWDERTRTLHLFQTGRSQERIMLECTLERTEQDILQDRYLNNWCQSWALAEACNMLAEIRGKYSTLPSASGGLTLNSGDLRARADKLMQDCMEEIDNGIANDYENYPASGILFG